MKLRSTQSITLLALTCGALRGRINQRIQKSRAVQLNPSGMLLATHSRDLDQAFENKTTIRLKWNELPYTVHRNIIDASKLGEGSEQVQ